MRTHAVFAAAMLISGPVFASGGLSCTADDDAVKLDIQSGVTRGMGSPLFNFQGRVQLSDASVPTDLKNTEFSDDHVAQYWLDDQRLNLGLYREREGDKPHGYVEIVVVTQPGDDEGLYGGQYHLTVFDATDNASSDGKTLKFDGTVSCFVE